VPAVFNIIPVGRRFTWGHAHFYFSPLSFFII